MNRALLRIVVVVAGAVSLWGGCRSPDEGKSTQSPNHYSRLNASGNYDLYLGPDIADHLARPASSDELKRTSYFMVGNVTPKLIQTARSKPNRVVSLAVNAPATAALTLMVNYLVGADPVTVSAKTGDPMVSGRVQIWIDEQDTPVGMFELNVWHRASNGKLSKDTYSTGLLPDPEMPPSPDPR
jgi:hypothetical protein